MNNRDNSKQYDNHPPNKSSTRRYGLECNRSWQERTKTPHPRASGGPPLKLLDKIRNISIAQRLFKRDSGTEPDDTNEATHTKAPLNPFEGLRAMVANLRARFKPYKFTRLELPFEDQVRRMRQSPDPDEEGYWMTRLAYRCLEYLDARGDVADLHVKRGSGARVEALMKRFDQGQDIDLIAEEYTNFGDNTDHDLDANVYVVASAFRLWLQQFWNKLMPEDLELANANAWSILACLEPSRYYLLCALTRHIHLLMDPQREHVVDVSEVCAGFARCLSLHAHVMEYLSRNWSICWKGCGVEGWFLNYNYTLDNARHLRFHNQEAVEWVRLM